jgi:hypothetical protein
MKKVVRACEVCHKEAAWILFSNNAFLGQGIAKVMNSSVIYVKVCNTEHRRRSDSEPVFFSNEQYFKKV